MKTFPFSKEWMVWDGEKKVREQEKGRELGLVHNKKLFFNKI